MKNGNNPICDNMNDPCGHYAQWKSQIQKHKYYITHISNLKQSNLRKRGVRMVVTCGWVERSIGSCWSKGTKFLFCKLSKSWRSIYYSICSLKCCIVYLKICQDVSPYVNFLNTKNTWIKKWGEVEKRYKIYS